MDVYVGEIRSVAFAFAPVGWALCDGSSQLAADPEYALLYHVIQNTYGGDATHFNLPDLRGRTPLHAGSGAGLSTYTVGQSGGAEGVALSEAHMPAHTHRVLADAGPASETSPAGNFFAAGHTQYGVGASGAATGAVLAATGGGAAHDNLMPYLCMNYIIALDGCLPS